MKHFYMGFILGALLKNKILNLGENVVKNSINVYHKIVKSRRIKFSDELINNLSIVVKIKNYNRFYETFPDYKVNKNFF